MDTKTKLLDILLYVGVISSTLTVIFYVRNYFLRRKLNKIIRDNKGNLKNYIVDNELTNLDNIERDVDNVDKLTFTLVEYLTTNEEKQKNIYTVCLISLYLKFNLLGDNEAFKVVIKNQEYFSKLIFSKFRDKNKNLMEHRLKNINLVLKDADTW